MSLKSWVLDRVQQMNGLAARHDLPPREPDFAPHPTRTSMPARARDAGGLDRHAEPTPRGGALDDAETLGAYAPLIGAVRDELEHFVASHVRLHVAIADRDRFVLTSIGVRCAGGVEPRRLLHRFLNEFKPEQVKRYLAREVIAGLPIASAIDLSQFAGLFDAETRVDPEEGEYAELLAALRTPPPTAPRPFDVSVLGRWSELDATRAAAADAPLRPAAAQGATPSTPLAGQRCEFDVQDADGRRRVVLQSVVPGRRYVVGKGDGCDIRVSGSYTSRRHAELWREQDTWWVADAGSTNGLRVEAVDGVRPHGGSAAAADADGGAKPSAWRLDVGARLVLSARADGPPADYPVLSMRPAADAIAAARLTPIATGSAAPRTPLTAVLGAPNGATVFKITALQACGVRTLEVDATTLPITVGRSRNQTLVVDRRHDGVSGHHLEIAGLDPTGADVVVHGDNGIAIAGVAHAPGTHCRWPVDAPLVLGAAADERGACTLLLTRAGTER